MALHDYEITGDGVIVLSDDSNPLPRDYGQSDAYREYRRRSPIKVEDLPRHGRLDGEKSTQ